MTPEIREALESACSVEPTGVIRSDHGGRKLGQWLTCDADKRVSTGRFRHRVIAFLREVSDDMTVAELRDELET